MLGDPQRRVRTEMIKLSFCGYQRSFGRRRLGSNGNIYIGIGRQRLGRPKSHPTAFQNIFQQPALLFIGLDLRLTDQFKADREASGSYLDGIQYRRMDQRVGQTSQRKADHAAGIDQMGR